MNALEEKLVLLGIGFLAAHGLPLLFKYIPYAIGWASVKLLSFPSVHAYVKAHPDDFKNLIDAVAVKEKQIVDQTAAQ